MTKTHQKEIEDLRFENAQIKETVEAKERLIDDLSMANEDMLKQPNDLKAAAPNERENNSDLAKYKEFLRRTQSQCKTLEEQINKEKEKHEKEVNELVAERMATEEKYGKIVKEKKLFEDKKRILLYAFDALKDLSTLNTNNSSKSMNSNSNEENVVNGDHKLLLI